MYAIRSYYDPHSVSPQTYMYEAMAYITAHGIKHLPVVDDGQLVGIVTMRELMRYRSQKAMLLVWVLTVKLLPSALPAAS